MSDVGLDRLQTVAEAIAILDATPVTPRVEAVPLAMANDRVLAAPVSADRDYPPFDKSLMDGYAVRAADTAVDGTLACVAEIAAGGERDVLVKPGECVAIMTGAPLPPGADAVVPVEWTSREGDSIRLRRGAPGGHAISRRAADTTAGTVVLAAGVRLGPTQIAVCAQVGVATPTVFARPRVGVLSTGDEIVPFDQTPAGSQIRNSNSPLLTALLARLGCEVTDLGHVPDEPQRIAAALQTDGLAAVLVTGGMSMGVYDFTPRVLSDLGYELAVTKLKIKPGKPFVFARSPGRPFVFGLPGNPVSAYVCTVRLVSRILARLSGRSPEPEWVPAALTADLPANGPREFYQPAVVENGQATVLGWRGSADVFSLAHANAVLVRPEDEGKLPAGAVVPLLRLP